MLPTVGVIGAGSSGIAAAKALHERGFQFGCFETSDRVGGLWVYGDRSGTSGAYRSLHINTSRDRMGCVDFPMPASCPDFPHRAQIAACFDAHVDRFGLRERITFETTVTRAERRDGGGWEIATDDGATTGLRRADRRQRAPLGPVPAVGPGRERSAVHSHDYRGDDPAFFRDKSVGVLGMGNSAMDIAVEASYSARAVFLAARRGAWVIPKYVVGRPLDSITPPPHVPFAARRRVQQAMLKLAAGDMKRTMFKRYVASPRHTMQVDFEDYVRGVRRERRRGAARAMAA